MFASTTRKIAMERVNALRRTYAAAGAAKAQSHDVVQRVFVEQQQKFRALLEKTKTLTPPIGGDATAVKAYAAKKLAILKEVRASSARDGLDGVAPVGLSATREWDAVMSRDGCVGKPSLRLIFSSRVLTLPCFFACSVVTNRFAG
jgi:hypothetical protein